MTSKNTTAYNAKNERVKRDYLRHQKDARGRAQATVDAMSKAIRRYEAYTGFKDLGTFNKDQAIAFRKHLLASKTLRTGQAMSHSTILHTLNPLKDFFGWLATQPGYKRRIILTDIDYLSLSDNEARAARAPKYRAWPTMEQIGTAIFFMPVTTEVECRNQALIAFAIVSGMRDSAIASLRLKHVNLEMRHIMQDPAEVKTKNRKRIDTFFFPVGEDLIKIVTDWIIFLRTEKLYGNDDPVFPQTAVAQDENQTFQPAGLKPAFWSTAAAIRNIFKESFENVGMPYFNPHSFRKTLGDLGQRACTTPQQLKAWSQNLGHDNVLTTFTSYGAVSTDTQGELIKSLAYPQQKTTITLARLQEFINQNTK